LITVSTYEHIQRCYVLLGCGRRASTMFQMLHRQQRPRACITTTINSYTTIISTMKLAFHWTQHVWCKKAVHTILCKRQEKSFQEWKQS